jgi:undecaprenyl pyrophosphate phosphatase UppP
MYYNMKKSIYGVVALLSAPVFVSAAGELTTFQNLAKSIGDIVETLLPVAASLAVLFFFFSLARYIFDKDGAGKKEAREQMFWGVIAIFVIFSIWGLVGFLRDTFGIKGDATITAPKITTTAAEYRVV